MRSYFVSVQSYLYRCGGFIYVRNVVVVDGRNLPHNFKLNIRLSTRRSDGKWAENTYEYKTSTEKITDFVRGQYRGMGKGMTLTDFSLKHFAAIGTGSLPLSSTANAKYRPYGGPEAKPGKG